ncbi:MAG TPA: choice-of-anchor B family protein [Phaeodactylibacter sp.]|nr:choice-of-anchor B family protein [Phaeodactylibacter sp.]
MKKLILFILPFLSLSLFAQQEATLLGTWTSSANPPLNFFSSAYNEVWGLAINGKEIAIMGTTLGTHFIDVTNPNNPVELMDEFVQGADYGGGIVHRDFHDYNGYLYAVSDEGSSTLQIIDISDLPNSTTVVYDSNEILQTSHNIFIDSIHARLYACGVRKATVGGFTSLQVIDISNPTEPVLLNDYNEIPYVHDIFVEDNIAYANCGGAGLFVVDFSDAASPTILGSMTTYTQQGYNHSGWIDPSGEYYFMADETWDMDLKVVNIQDLNDISVINTFSSEQTLTTIPHNLIARCDRLYVSYYYDGLQVFDISDPTQPVRIYYYDTSTIPNTDGYAGAWGVYPLLPSGNILVSDMQNGLFVLEAISDHSCENTIVKTYTPQNWIDNINIFPQPANDFMKIELQSIDNQQDTNFELIDLTGKTIQIFPSRDLFFGKNEFTFTLDSSIPSGIYFLKIFNSKGSVTRKLIIE